MGGAIMRTKQMTMSVSAAPQPRACAPVNADDALTKICDGSEVLGPLNTFGLAAVTVRMVNRSGAVSPAARATASRAPLTIPPTAAGTPTVTVTRDLVHPPANL